VAKDLTIDISGMHCGACVNRLTQALKKIPGVEVDDVQVGTAKVRYDESQADDAAIQAAIRKVGFEVNASK
jgi:copper chaperone